MSTIDKSELERIEAAVKGRKFSHPLETSALTSPHRSRDGRSVAQLFETVATGAGLDLRKIAKQKVAEQRAARRTLDKQEASFQKKSTAAEAAFRSGMVSRREALKLLGAPFTSSFLNLDKPFLVWQLPNPQLDIFIDSQIASMDSSVSVRVDTNDGSNSTEFVFYFLWMNESDFFAVANVGSSLILNGSCTVQAATGLFSGHKVDLTLSARLGLWRWSGWGTDPETGNSNDQTLYPQLQSTQFKQIAALHAEGGSIIGAADIDGRTFSFETFPVSHSLFVIPGKAVALFQVSLSLFYNLNPGGDIADNVQVSLAENSRRVICPNVELEILTPLPGQGAVEQGRVVGSEMLAD